MPTPHRSITRRRFAGQALASLLAAGAVPVLVRAATPASEPLPALRFTPGLDLAAWQRELRQKLGGILGLSPARGPLEGAREPAPAPDPARYTLERIRFDAEPGETVPGYLLRPRDGRPRHPVMICLQGHSPGMHISIGQAGNEAERKAIAGGRDLALQAVARGWAALVIEQRAFGVRASPGVSCNDAALRALHRGRPLTGQRVADVMRAVDFAAAQPDLDVARLGCMGNSTGGTVAFYAAAVDPRIQHAVVSCSFCTFADSWLSLPHCACGYLPGILQVADMPDLAGLIAPRQLLIVAGRNDPLARLSGVEDGFRHAQAIFAAAGARDHVRLVIGEGGHQFYPDQAWPVITELTGVRAA